MEYRQHSDNLHLGEMVCFMWMCLDGSIYLPSIIFLSSALLNGILTLLLTWRGFPHGFGTKRDTFLPWQAWSQEGEIF